LFANRTECVYMLVANIRSNDAEFY
jgi:hypothetical protein